MFKKYWIYIVLVMLSVPTIMPLFHEGFFSMHDDTQVVRVQQMYKALVDGQFPVRWVTDLGYGYGYPIFNFYGPLPYYIGALFMFLGMPGLIATKLMFAIGIVGASITMYLLAKSIWGTFPAIIVATLYQYSPYHAVDIYVRGAVSEFWAILILPIILLGIVKVERIKLSGKNNTLSLVTPFVVISVSYACLILTHNITAMIASVFLGIGAGVALLYVAVIYLFRQTIVKSLLFKTLFIGSALTFGLGLSAFFWVPAFSETTFTNVNSVIGGGADYRDHYVYLEQLWDSPWGFGGSVKGKADGMSFKVGKIAIVLALFSLVVLGWQTRTKSASRRLIVYTFCIVIATLFAIFMSTSPSQFIWETISLFAFIQYPWRFLVFIILGFSLLSGGLFTIRKGVFMYALSILSLLLIIYTNTKYFQPQQYIVLDNSVYSSDEYVKWWVSRISDEYMPKGFQKPSSFKDVVVDKFIFTDEIVADTPTIKTDYYAVNYNAPSEEVAHINLAYFPGWTVLLDGNVHPFSVKNDGIEVVLPSGEHTLEVARRSTTLQSVATIISLFCLIVIFGTIIGLKYSYGKKV